MIAEHALAYDMLSEILHYMEFWSAEGGEMSPLVPHLC